MRSSLTLASRVTLFALIGISLVGCAHSRRGDLWFQHLGVRPDEPKVAIAGGTTGTPAKTVCDVYVEYAAYAQQLQEAYHSRATQNRFWIYAAGILGLGAAAASGGLAAAAAGATTIALVAISGGFAAGTFAAIDNSELAKVYTIAANKIEATVLDADRQQRAASTPPDAGCAAALGVLKDGVSEARTMLELARTNNAVLALIRAKEEQKALARLIESVEEANPTRVTLSASITRIDQTTFPDVVLTVSNIQLDRVAPADIKVMIGSADPISPRVSKTDEFTYSVQFRAPDNAPNPPQKEYPVTLLVGKSKQSVTSKDKLTYP
jgi:hypothetical protein